MFEITITPLSAKAINNLGTIETKTVKVIDSSHNNHRILVELTPTVSIWLQEFVDFKKKPKPKELPW